MPKTQINDLLEAWTASMLLAHPTLTDASGPFADATQMLASIDSIQVGDAPWKYLECNRAAGVTESSPQWMKQTYYVWYRDIDKMADLTLANPDFKREFDFVPYNEYDSQDNQRYCDFFSADWSWEQAICKSLPLSFTSN